MKRKIFITTQFEGKHNYPNAPDEVSFLRYPHRHIFHVKVQISVDHNERDLEFFIVKKKINEMIKQNYSEGSVSCEQMAENILHLCKYAFGKNRSYSVEVNEDGENGAIVEDEHE